MTQTIHGPLHLFSEGTELRITGYTLPEPSKGFVKGSITQWQIEAEYKLNVNKWQASKISAKVQEESIKQLYWAWCDKFNRDVSIRKFKRECALGIDITSLADRLEYYQVGDEWFVLLKPASNSPIPFMAGVEPEDQEQNLNDIIEFHKTGHSNKAILGNFTITRK